MFRFYVLQWVFQLLRRAAQAHADRRQRAASRRDLQLLDEQGLRDLGLSHHAAAESWLRPR